MDIKVIRTVFLLMGLQKCYSQVIYTEVPQPVVYDIAGIFDKDAVITTNAFEESIRHATKKALHLNPVIFRPPRTDSYSVWRELCTNSEIRPIAVVGPQSEISHGAVREQCTAAHIPHLQATWQPYQLDLEVGQEEPSEETDETGDSEETEEDIEADDTEGTEENGEAKETENTEEQPITFKPISINFFPDPYEVAQVYAKLLKYYKWDAFAVLYEDHFGLMRIQKLLAEHTTQYPVLIRKLEPNGDNHGIFKDIKQYQESRILIDCHPERIKNYIEIASNLSMLNTYQHYMFMSMDASIMTQELMKYESNFTWLSITEYEKIGKRHFLQTRVDSWKPGTLPLVTDFKMDALLMDDIANHVLEAMQEVTDLLKQNNLEVSQPEKLCQDVQYWDQGALFQNKLLTLQRTGVSGNIQFNEMGKRINYTLYVNEIHLTERHTIGKWESANGEDLIIDSSSSDSAQLKNYEFRVISRAAEPYFSKNDSWKEGDDEKYKYMGFSVDFIDEIFKTLKADNFSYTYKFILNKDNQTGMYNNETKKWTGLIGTLLDQEADLAVGDLTITEERKAVVDFSVPFMSLGIGILFLKEEKETPPIFSFLNPFDFEVWMYTATAYCVVSIVLYVCARISPSDWENPQPCDKDPEELENIWNFKNCTWLTMGSIMTQGCDILPKGLGTRLICGVWWFFVIIVCQTYIAQLSASMSSALDIAPINSVEDLVKRNNIRYGCIGTGSTLSFFKNSKDKIYQTMYQNMISNPAVFTSSNHEGAIRVSRSKHKYAFFMESTTIQYEIMRDCNLKKVGEELDSKDYGIAMPANSPFRSNINRAILKLKERTIIENIQKKWWEEEGGAKECEEPKEDDVEGDLEMENLIGLFLVLIIGLLFGVIITAFEFFDGVRNIVVKEQVSHEEAFRKELRASLNFFQLQKPVFRNPSRAASLMPSENAPLLDSQEKQEKRAALLQNFMESEKQM